MKSDSTETARYLKTDDLSDALICRGCVTENSAKFAVLKILRKEICVNFIQMYSKTMLKDEIRLYYEICRSVKCEC